MEKTIDAIKSNLENIGNATALIKNSISFSYFGSQFNRNNLIGHNGQPCFYNDTKIHGENNGCQIFQLEYIVNSAGGNFTE